MAQLTIYLDRDTAEKVEAAARREGASLSRWARKHLSAAAATSDWPEGYWKFFEDIEEEVDESFREPEELDAGADVERVGF